MANKIDLQLIIIVYLIGIYIILKFEITDIDVYTFNIILYGYNSKFHVYNILNKLINSSNYKKIL